MNTKLRSISTVAATSPGGHYSQAIVHSGLVYISGQLGFSPGTNEVVVGSVEQQVRNCLENLRRILEASGSSLSQVVKVVVYVSDVSLWPEIDRVYAQTFESHRPARSVIPCGKLHYGFDVEIDAIAALH